MTPAAIGPALVGLQLGPVEHRWSPRDAILYSLGIGARLPRDLEFLYERCGPRVEPTFALTAVTAMLPLLVERLGIDLRRLLHAGQRLTVLRQLEPAGTVLITRTITGVSDKRTAALIECEDTVADDQGVLATAASQWWITGAGGFGGPAGERAGERAVERPVETTGASAPVAQPDRQPDVRMSVPTSAEQAALYRLSGDRNPVHIDPGFAREAGQPRPLLHGLCTLGALGHALSAHAGGRQLAELSARFRAPVFPGDRLDIEIWKVDDARAMATVSVAGRLVLGPAQGSFA